MDSWAPYKNTSLLNLELGHLSWVSVEIEHITNDKSCPTLCDPMAYTVPGILQARILEWVAVPFSTGSSQPRDQTQVSHIAGGFLTN